MNIRGWILVVVVLLCLIFGGVSYNRLASRLPHTIAIASGSEAGQYHHLAQELKEFLKLEYPRITVEIKTSNGSAENLDLIKEGEVQFAFYQNNSRSQTEEASNGKLKDADRTDGEVRAVANLYAEVLHIVVRKSTGIETIRDLRKVNVSVGPKGSGTFQIAAQVLSHYDIRMDSKRMHGLDFAGILSAFENGKIDAAFIVTRNLSPTVTNLLQGSVALAPP